jgi:hypothetical protein
MLKSNLGKIEKMNKLVEDVSFFLVCGVPAAYDDIIVQMGNNILSLLQSSIGPTLLQDPFVQECLSQMLDEGSVERTLLTCNHLVSTLDEPLAYQYIENLRKKHKTLVNVTFSHLDPTLLYYV